MYCISVSFSKKLNFANNHVAPKAAPFTSQLGVVDGRFLSQGCQVEPNGAGQFLRKQTLEFIASYFLGLSYKKSKSSNPKCQSNWAGFLKEGFSCKKVTVILF